MRISSPIVVNLIFAFIVIFTSLFALGFWIFVMNNKEKTGKIQHVKMDKNEKFEEFFTSSNLTMNPKENTVTIHKNQQIKQMIDMAPIKLDDFGLIPMNNAKDIERKESPSPMAMAFGE